MEGQPVTTNPLLIMIINMTVVFGVLILLGYVIELIHWMDPTRKKEVKKEPIKTTAPVQTVASAPAVVEASVEEDGLQEKTIKAVITTAIMASGHKDFEIKSIRKV